MKTTLWQLATDRWSGLRLLHRPGLAQFSLPGVARLAIKVATTSSRGGRWGALTRENHDR